MVSQVLADHPDPLLQHHQLVQECVCGSLAITYDTMRGCWAIPLNDVRQVNKWLKTLCVLQVGNYTQDQYYYGRLEDMTADANPRPVYFTTTANGACTLELAALPSPLHEHADLFTQQVAWQETLLWCCAEVPRCARGAQLAANLP